MCMYIRMERHTVVWWGLRLVRMELCSYALECPPGIGSWPERSCQTGNGFASSRVYKSNTVLPKEKTVRRMLCGQFLFGNYLAAAAAAAIVTATAVVAATVAATAIAAANEQQDQNDDPPAAVTTKTVSTTHNSSTPLNKM